MSRRALIAVVLAVAWPGSAAAQDLGAELAGVDVGGNQDLGAHLGMALGGGVTPGGVHIGGRYLYRLSDVDWFDSGLGFTFGGGTETCFRDRDDSLICDQGALDGFGAEVSLGIRRYFTGKNEFYPYLHAGVAGRLVSYGDDDLLGVAVPLWIGAGVRAEVTEGVAVGGGAVLSAGPAWMNRDLGLEPEIGLVIAAGVDFRID